MELDLDQILEKQVLPWDLTIKMKGVTYTTRPLILADVASLQKVISNSDKNADGAKAVVASLFVDPKPDVGAWTMDQTVGAVKAILSYWQRSSEKNSRIRSNEIILSTPLW